MMVKDLNICGEKRSDEQGPQQNELNKKKVFF